MPKQKDARSDLEGCCDLRVFIHVRDGTDIDDELEVVERRVRFALARFGPVLRRARVEFTPRHEGVACRIQLYDAGTEPISVLAVAADAMLALRDAIEQAVHELARRLRRGRALAARLDTSTST